MSYILAHTKILEKSLSIITDPDSPQNPPVKLIFVIIIKMTRFLVLMKSKCHIKWGVKEMKQINKYCTGKKNKKNDMILGGREVQERCCKKVMFNPGVE